MVRILRADGVGGPARTLDGRPARPGLAADAAGAAQAAAERDHFVLPIGDVPARETHALASIPAFAGARRSLKAIVEA